MYNVKGQDTTDLENRIDVMVYKLYDLTYEEVKTVDPEFWMSEEEYDRTPLSPPFFKGGK